MEKLSTITLAMGLALATGQAAATVYNIVGTNSGGVSYVEEGAVNGDMSITNNWDMTGPFPVYTGTTADVISEFNATTVPMYVTGGTWDDVTGIGSWSYELDMTGFGTGLQHAEVHNQGFQSDSSGNLTLDSIYPAECTGPLSVCLGFVQTMSRAVLIPFGTDTLGAGDYAFGGPVEGLSVFLTFTSTEVPLPASVWLFNAALLGLAGARARSPKAVARH